MLESGGAQREAQRGADEDERERAEMEEARQVSGLLGVEEGGEKKRRRHPTAVRGRSLVLS